MNNDIITLSVDKITGSGSAKGLLYVYRALDCSEVETEVDVYFEWSPEQKQTMIDPHIPMSVEIVNVADEANDIEFDLNEIDNLAEMSDHILTIDCE